MNPILLSAVGGALAMYFLDPQAGRRRRARTRDKMQHYQRRVRDGYDLTLRDTRQRARGLLATGRRVLRRESVADETLTERVRAVLGRYASHPHALEVSSQEGAVTLSGPILAHEVHPLLHAAKGVAGVRSVHNDLQPHRDTEHVSSLQGGVPRRGARFELLQKSWSPAARLAVAGFGFALLARRGIFARLGGVALVARALSNLDFETLLGLGHAHGIEVNKTLCVDAPVREVFAFWSDYQNFPRFMTNVREVRVSEDRSHWIVNGPAGVPVEWSSELVRFEQDALIEWRSLPGSKVRHDGVVRFEPAGEAGTRVSVCLRYVPPGGALGHAVASLLGADPKTEMDGDLMRMKGMIETGRAPHDAAQPA
jgi:uncharacterized membrane protein